MFYPGELESAARAMQAKRRELIAKPLASIYQDLAEAALMAAAIRRIEYLEKQLDVMIEAMSPGATHHEVMVEAP